MRDDILGRANETERRSGRTRSRRAGAHCYLPAPLIVMEQRLTPIHESALADAMRLIVQFSERTGIPIPELNVAAKAKLTTFTSDITWRLATAANRTILVQIRERFSQRVIDTKQGATLTRSAISRNAWKEEPVFLEDLRRVWPTITSSTIDRTLPGPPSPCRCDRSQ